MTKRSKRQQTKHDQAVQKSAEYYEKQGYDVQADISGYEKPETINNRRPDVIAKKGVDEVILEVETKDSVGKDKAQQKAFEDYADAHKNARFRKKII